MKRITYIEPFSDGYSTFSQKDGRKEGWGIMDRKGNIIVPPDYSMIVQCGNGAAALWGKRGKGVKYIDIASGTPLEGCPHRDGSRLLLCRAGRYGVEGSAGGIIVPIKYRSVLWEEPYYRVQDCRGKWGILSDEGNTLVPCRYDYISYGNKGAFPALNSESGAFLLHLDGTVTLPAVRCSRMELFQDSDFVAVWVESLEDDMTSCGLMDRSGQFIITHSYHRIYDCLDNTFLADIPNDDYPETELSGAIQTLPFNTDTNSTVRNMMKDLGLTPISVTKTIIPFIYFDFWRRSDFYFASLNSTRLFGLLSSTGETLIPFEYDWMEPSDDLSLIPVCKGDEWYFIDSAGNRVLL